MKIINLTEKSTVYTANVYFILGNWNALPDVNTLIDVGRDPQIIEKINNGSFKYSVNFTTPCKFFHVCHVLCMFSFLQKDSLI